MATDLPNEVQIFQQFLAERSSNGNGPSTIDEALDQFGKYQAELAGLKAKLQEGAIWPVPEKAVVLQFEC